jgi:8-oxo-dGTP diphosphatase
MAVERDDAGEVRAAGGVASRTAADGTIEVLLVHRAQYDDWSLPKGKAEAGESDEACAIREVEEETGLRCRLGAELPTVRYRDRFGRPKIVRYWWLDVEAGEAVASNEVDDVAWLPVAEAIERISYERDRTVLRAVEAACQDPNR